MTRHDGWEKVGTGGTESTGLTAEVDVLDDLAHLLGITPPPGAPWCAATVVLYGRRGDVVTAQLRHLQDLDLPLAEKHLLALAERVITERRGSGYRNGEIGRSL